MGGKSYNSTDDTTMERSSWGGGAARSDVSSLTDEDDRGITLSCQKDKSLSSTIKLKAWFTFAVALCFVGALTFATVDESRKSRAVTNIFGATYSAETLRLLASDEFASCDDPLETTISVNTNTGDVLVNCGTDGAQFEIVGGESLFIQVGNQTVTINNDNNMMEIFAEQDDDVFNAGVIKMSAMLGARGYDGKGSPETMPFHYYALMLSQSGIVKRDTVQGLKEASYGVSVYNDQSACNYPHNNQDHDHSGTGIRRTMCGGEACLPSVCGDCCFHAACYGFQYCCKDCSDGEKSTIGMSANCGTPGRILFETSCDLHFEYYQTCHQQCPLPDIMALYARGNGLRG